MASAKHKGNKESIEMQDDSQENGGESTLSSHLSSASPSSSIKDNTVHFCTNYEPRDSTVKKDSRAFLVVHSPLRITTSTREDVGHSIPSPASVFSRSSHSLSSPFGCSSSSASPGRCSYPSCVRRRWAQQAEMCRAHSDNLNPASFVSSSSSSPTVKLIETTDSRKGLEKEGKRSEEENHWNTESSCSPRSSCLPRCRCRGCPFPVAAPLSELSSPTSDYEAATTLQSPRNRIRTRESRREEEGSSLCSQHTTMDHCKCQRTGCSLYATRKGVVCAHRSQAEARCCSVPNCVKCARKDGVCIAHGALLASR